MTALVICNSFDAEKYDIEDFLEEKRILAEMFEIDRIRKEERQDYLNCIYEVNFHDLFYIEYYR